MKLIMRRPPYCTSAYLSHLVKRMAAFHVGFIDVFWELSRANPEQFLVLECDRGPLDKARLNHLYDALYLASALSFPPFETVLQKSRRKRASLSGGCFIG